MRGYGQPEYLWQRFDDWYKAPIFVRPLVANYAAVGFRLRWPAARVVVRTKEQEAWAKRHTRGQPLTILERIERLFDRWEAELRAHHQTLLAHSATPPVFYRIPAEQLDAHEHPPGSTPAASPDGSVSSAHSSPQTPLDAPLTVYCPPTSPNGQPLWTHWSPADTHEPRLFALDQWVVSQDS
ncbi:hypothetical protein PENSPDRAFT_672291 [Peniophora sp. CONT]|nr:hypothetical protein PENSPDRAFT_672291 [Peniophora sp. CONT]